MLSSLASNLRQRDLARLETRERAQAEGEAKYRRIVDLAQEGIWIIDAEHRTPFVNRRTAAMLGYSELDPHGRDFLAYVDKTGQPPAIICGHIKEPWPAAYVCVPMMDQNESLWVLHLQRPAANGASEAQPAWSEAQLGLARAVADTLAMALASLRLRALGTDLRQGAPGRVTMSIGVPAFPEHGDNGLAIARLADATLYQAKRAGRDQVLAAGAAV